jgi:hypothetical protein
MGLRQKKEGANARFGFLRKRAGKASFLALALEEVRTPSVSLSLPPRPQGSKKAKANFVSPIAETVLGQT